MGAITIQRANVDFIRMVECGRAGGRVCLSFITGFLYTSRGKYIRKNKMTAYS